MCLPASPSFDTIIRIILWVPQYLIFFLESFNTLGKCHRNICTCINVEFPYRLLRYLKNIFFIRKWHCLLVTISTPELKLSADLSYIKKLKHMVSFSRDQISHAYLSVIGVVDWQLESIATSLIGSYDNE